MVHSQIPGDSTLLPFSHDGGFVREAVNVSRIDDEWKLQFSIWELTIPDSHLDENFRAALRRERSMFSQDFKDRRLANLASVLISQGCLTLGSDRSEYTLDEVRFIVGAMAARWYGTYYAHPFWGKLRNGSLSLTQVFGWTLRTYHLSRSAGPTAARGAVHSPTAKIRNTFLDSALEEYSHCQIYYFPLHPKFGLESDWLKMLAPSPCGLAFDQHMAVIAEDDWLAHTISAYFQEYTAAFRENAFALYDRLEATYGLSGFFKGWKDHIGYDVEQTHAEEFEELLAGRETVTKAQLLRSLTLASYTVEYLIGALDELDGLPPSTPINQVRVTPAMQELGARRSTMFDGVDITSAEFASTSTALDWLVQVAAKRVTMNGSGVSALRDAIPNEQWAAAATRSLSTAATDDEIIVLGAFLEALPPAIDPLAPNDCAGWQAVFNFLRETARNPSDFSFILSLSTKLGANDKSPWRAMTDPCADWAGVKRTAADDARMATVGLQFLEMLFEASTFRAHLTPVDILD